MRLYLREKRISKTDLRRVVKKYIFGKTMDKEKKDEWFNDNNVAG
jgi:hypothetical protein